MIFEQGPPTQEQDNHDTCQRSRELNLGLMSSKGMDKDLRNATFNGQQSRAPAQAPKRELKWEMTIKRLSKLRRRSRIALFNTRMLTEDKRGDTYGTTQITSTHTYIMVLSKLFETLNPISLNDYY